MTTLTASASGTSTRTTVRVGHVLTVLVTAFLLFDAVIHIMSPAVVVDGARALGFDPGVMPVIGVLELALVVLFVVRRTSVLGAVLLTGYLGGAFCAQLRIDAPVFSTLLFPVYLGIIVWASLYLRDQRVRDLVAGR